MVVHVRVTRRTKRLYRKKSGGSEESRSMMVFIAVKRGNVMPQTVFVAIWKILTEERFERLNNW